jgi:hypothetical protein
MAARSTAIALHNETEFDLINPEIELPHGQWTDPWQPPSRISAHSIGEFRSESDGFLTGTEGSVRYHFDHGGAATVYVHWDNPFDGVNSYHQFTDNGFEVYHTGGDGNDARIDVFLLVSVPHFVPGFKPSTNGFKFTNHWDNAPYTLPPLRGSILDLKYGNAKNGLCGGMVYTVRDYYHASRLIPQTTSAPAGEQDPLFIHIVNRLFDTFDIDDVTMYLKLMDPVYPDTDENVLNPVGLANGRAYVMAVIEFPMIRDDLLAGRPSPLGLVSVKSLLPSDLGECHQVLAYGYQQSGNDVTIWVYDPNTTLDAADSVTLRFSVRTTAERIDVQHNVDMKDNGQLLPVYAFFRTNYLFSPPPLGTFSLRLYGASHSLDLSGGVRHILLNGLPITHLRALA